MINQESGPKFFGFDLELFLLRHFMDKIKKVHFIQNSQNHLGMCLCFIINHKHIQSRPTAKTYN